MGKKPCSQQIILNTHGTGNILTVSSDGLHLLLCILVPANLPWHSPGLAMPPHLGLLCVVFSKCLFFIQLPNSSPAGADALASCLFFIPCMSTFWCGCTAPVGYSAECLKREQLLGLCSAPSSFQLGNPQLEAVNLEAFRICRKCSFCQCSVWYPKCANKLPLTSTPRRLQQPIKAARSSSPSSTHAYLLAVCRAY